MPVLVDVGHAISKLPQDLTWHRQIRRVYDQRRAMIDSGEGIDWAMAEALAFGTLVNEGAPPLHNPALPIYPALAPIVPCQSKFDTFHF